jgi:hypothetical protein
MAAGVKGTKGIVRNISVPPPIWDRIEAAAAARYASPTGYITRFLIENIDALHPEGRDDSKGEA